MKFEPLFVSRAAAGAVWVNIAITLTVMISPIGVGEGSGMIGDSIVRLIVLCVAQVPIALAAMAASFYCLAQRHPWLGSLFFNLVVSAATVYLYFAQNAALKDFFS